VDDYHETLLHDWNLGALYNTSPKIRVPSSKKNLGPKTCKILGDFMQLQTLIVNVIGTS